ncbi:MAG: DUF3293 domain-containing protein [Chthonomonadales bacterium]
MEKKLAPGVVQAESTEELDESYRGANYVVDSPSGRLTLKIGAFNDDLEVLLRLQNVNVWSIITAHNPASRLLTPEENAVRHTELTLTINQFGFQHYEGYGACPAGDWPHEMSLFILGIEREQAMELGQHFGQNAIVCGDAGGVPQLVWCTDAN